MEKDHHRRTNLCSNTKNRWPGKESVVAHWLKTLITLELDESIVTELQFFKKKKKTIVVWTENEK